jgi:hypothetical protein
MCAGLLHLDSFTAIFAFNTCIFSLCISFKFRHIFQAYHSGFVCSCYPFSLSSVVCDGCKGLHIHTQQCASYFS